MSFNEEQNHDLVFKLALKKNYQLDFDLEPTLDDTFELKTMFTELSSGFVNVLSGYCLNLF